MQTYLLQQVGWPVCISVGLTKSRLLRQFLVHILYLVGKSFHRPEPFSKDEHLLSGVPWLCKGLTSTWSWHEHGTHSMAMETKHELPWTRWDAPRRSHDPLSWAATLSSAGFQLALGFLLQHCSELYIVIPTVLWGFSFTGWYYVFCKEFF